MKTKKSTAVRFLRMKIKFVKKLFNGTIFYSPADLTEPGLIDADKELNLMIRVARQHPQGKYKDAIRDGLEELKEEFGMTSLK